MTLSVPIDQFAEAVRRVLGQDDAYVAPAESGSIATAFSVVKKIRLVSSSPEPADRLCEILRSANLKVQGGQWVAPEEALPSEVHTPTYIAAIAYATGHTQPGIWVDAFPSLPTQAQALRSLFDEFKETGEIADDVAFEEFVRQANPTVVIVSPTELRSFADSKES
jgi:hypothetical protein